MKVGIYVCWQKHDAALAAAGLATHLCGRSVACSIRTRTWRTGPVDPFWDRRVEGGRRHFHPWALDKKRIARRLEKADFRAWAARQDVIVWPGPPDEDDYLWLMFEARKRQVVWCGLDMLQPADEWVLGLSTKLLLPSRRQYDVVAKHYTAADADVAPFDAGMPTAFKPPRADKYVRLFMSLHGSQLRKVERAAVGVLVDVARRNPHVLCVAAGAKGLDGSAVDEMRRAGAELGPRFRFEDDRPWPDHQAFMAEADLTVWPAVYEGMGIVGVTSMSVGTPVLANKIMPVTDYFADKVNSRLLPCQSSANWLGVPRARPEYGRMAEALHELVQQPDYLAYLSLGASNTHMLRRQAFSAAWDKHLGVV